MCFVWYVVCLVTVRICDEDSHCVKQLLSGVVHELCVVLFSHEHACFSTLTLLWVNWIIENFSFQHLSHYFLFIIITGTTIAIIIVIIITIITIFIFNIVIIIIVVIITTATTTTNIIIIIIIRGRNSSLVVFGLAVHSVAGSILLWGNFPVEGIFPLELTWFKLHSPKNYFGWEYKPRSSLCTHAFHRTDSKDPDVHMDGWMPATKTHPARTIHEDGMWLP